MRLSSMRLSSQHVLCALVVARLVLVGGCVASPARDERTLRPPLPAAVHVSSEIAVAQCLSVLGPTIARDGTVVLDRVGTRIVFANRGSSLSTAGMGSDERPVDDHALEIAPANLAGAAAGRDPYVWAQLVDRNGAPLGSETYLGRCSEGLGSIGIDLEMPAELVMLDAPTTHCGSAHGPAISRTGELRVDGFSLRLVLRERPQDDRTVAFAVVDHALDLTVIPSDTLLEQPKPSVVGGASDGPWVYVVPIEATSVALLDASAKGRCAQRWADDRDEAVDEAVDESLASP